MKRVFTAFGQSADGAESELTSEEFREMYCTIVSAPPECADSPSGVEEAIRDASRLASSRCLPTPGEVVPM